jgi:alpha/beta superfamily hydrolase
LVEEEEGEEERREVQREVDFRKVGRSEAGWDGGWLENKDEGDAGSGE